LVGRYVIDLVSIDFTSSFTFFGGMGTGQECRKPKGLKFPHGLYANGGTLELELGPEANKSWGLGEN